MRQMRETWQKERTEEHARAALGGAVSQAGHVHRVEAVGERGEAVSSDEEEEELAEIQDFLMAVELDGALND